MLRQLTRQRIAFEVIKVLANGFSHVSNGSNPPSPFRKAFLNNVDFDIRRDWYFLLSLGVEFEFLQNISCILSDGQEIVLSSYRENQLMISQTQKELINKIIVDLRNESNIPNIAREDKLICISPNSRLDVQLDEIKINIFIEDDTEISAIDLLIETPCAGEMRGEKHKILEAKAALFRKYPEKRVRYYIGFPFDPTSDTPLGYNKTRFINSIIGGTKYFAPEEILLAGELWDFLSGDTNTMKQILDIINAIAPPQFMDNFNFLRKGENRKNDPERYRSLLQKWFLFSELYLFENDRELTQKLQTTSDKRTYRQLVFTLDGKYKFQRYHHLSNILRR